MYKIPANLGFASNLVHYLPTCHSTNEIAAIMLAEGLEEGTIVITDDQTAGIGQPGNSWESQPYTNLTFSLILKPKFLKIENLFLLTQAISLGLANAIQEFVSGIVKIKWPNDIFIGDKKVAGILIQNAVKNRAFESSIVGIGLNVNQQEFKTTNAISLRKVTGGVLELNEVLQELIKGIYTEYDQLQKGIYDKLNNEYHQLLYGRDEVKQYESEKRFAGKIIGTDPQGRLIIETTEGIRLFRNQEVKLIGG